MPNVLSLSFDRPVAVVGDIHGCSDLLRALLDRLGTDVPIIVVGDVCDRGPDTKGVLDLLVARKAVGVLGNHDSWFRTWATGEGFDTFCLNKMMGGEATLRSYGVQARTPREVEAQKWRVPSDHRDWLAGMVAAVDLTVCGERFWVVHTLPAAVPEGVEIDEAVPYLAETRAADLQWPSTPPENVPKLDRTVVMGHQPQDEPVDLGWVVAVDTGAGTVPGGKLTAVVLPERRFVTAE